GFVGSRWRSGKTPRARSVAGRGGQMGQKPRRQAGEGGGRRSRSAGSVLPDGPRPKRPARGEGMGSSCRSFPSRPKRDPGPETVRARPAQRKCGGLEIPARRSLRFDAVARQRHPLDGQRRWYCDKTRRRKRSRDAGGTRPWNRQLLRVAGGWRWESLLRERTGGGKRGRQPVGMAADLVARISRKN